MSLLYIRDNYQVPAEKGRRVIYTGDQAEKKGIIVDSKGAYIRVLFDGEKRPVNLHPTWKVEYGEMGELPKMTRSQKRYQDFLSSGFDNFMEYLGYEQELRHAVKCGFRTVYEFRKWLDAEPGVY